MHFSSFKIMKTFKELNVSNSMVEELEKHGIVIPTLVQEKTIPLILEKKDVLIQSETGSGKTIGYAIPTIENIKPLKRVQVLVILPTRELAKQVSEEYVKFSRKKDLVIAVVYGGVSMERQIQQVKSADVVVGTPGRLLDLLHRRVLNLTYCTYMVIDEADRLLDMGFIDDINSIIRFMPLQKQSIMCSATINSRVLELMNRYLKNPVKILLENILKTAVLKQYYYDVKEDQKISLLIHLLKNAERNLTLVFCKTKGRTKFVAAILRKHNFSASCLNGDMTQFMREKTMRDFAEGKIKVLVATDVAARGLHVENITHIFNYDLADDADMHTHRIGRTARCGKHGTSIILLSDKDYHNMYRVTDRYKDIEKKEAGNFEKIKLQSRGFGERRRFSRRRR